MRPAYPPGGAAPAESAPPHSRLVVAERVDQLALAHLRAALDADVGGLLLQLLLRLVLVLRGLAALLRRLAAARLRVGDARRLLLAGTALAHPLVGLVVLHRRAVV